MEFAHFISYVRRTLTKLAAGHLHGIFNFVSLSVQYNLYIPETVILTCFNTHVVMQNNGT